MNMPLQGTASDIIKLAMVKLYKELKNLGLNTKMILQVHDEMMIETPEDEIEDVKRIMKKCMESAIELKVPLIVDISEATNWYECK